MIPGAICPPRRRKPTPGAPYGRPFRGGNCSECGKEFWVKCKMQVGKQETCSHACATHRRKRLDREKREALGPPPKRRCVICDTWWQPKHRKVRRTTCSDPCERELHRRQNADNLQFRKRGEPLPEEIRESARQIRELHEFLDKHMAERKAISEEHWDAELLFDEQCRIRDEKVAEILSLGVRRK